MSHLGKLCPAGHACPAMIQADARCTLDPRPRAVDIRILPPARGRPPAPPTVRVFVPDPAPTPAERQRRALARPCPSLEAATDRAFRVEGHELDSVLAIVRAGDGWHWYAIGRIVEPIPADPASCPACAHDRARRARQTLTISASSSEAEKCTHALVRTKDYANWSRAERRRCSRVVDELLADVGQGPIVTTPDEVGLALRRAVSAAELGEIEKHAPRPRPLVTFEDALDRLGGRR